MSGWVFPVRFTVHRTWTTGIWAASCARWAVFLICEDWVRSRVKLYKLSNTNINCYWIIYKCDVGIFQMCESWLQCMATPCLSLVSPGLEKALMGRPISHAPKTTSSKQGQAIRKGPNLIALCSGYNLQWEGREEKPTYPPSTYPSGG